MVQVFGFIRLGRTPNIRNGPDSSPRSGIGNFICCQQPRQILECPSVIAETFKNLIAARVQGRARKHAHHCIGRARGQVHALTIADCLTLAAKSMIWVRIIRSFRPGARPPASRRCRGGYRIPVFRLGAGSLLVDRCRSENPGDGTSHTWATPCMSPPTTLVARKASLGQAAEFSCSHKLLNRGSNLRPRPWRFHGRAPTFAFALIRTQRQPSLASPQSVRRDIGRLQPQLDAKGCGRIDPTCPVAGPGRAPGRGAAKAC